MSIHASTFPFPRRVDWVWMTIVGVFSFLTLTNAGQALNSLHFVVTASVSVLPLFIVSIGLTAFATSTGAENLIARVFVGKSASTIVFASLMGALSPFCSCGVIPLIAALISMGVPLPAVMAFWLASPLMDPAMFVLTISVLGTNFAVAKTLAAISIGLLGGFGTLALSSYGFFNSPLRDSVGNGGCARAKVRSPGAVQWAFWNDPVRKAKFIQSFIKNGAFLGKMLVLAFTLESLMVAYIPQGWIAGLLGGQGIGAIFLATAIGIPAYLNGTAALPLVRELLAQGMSPGAGMAFLLGGGVTSIPAALAVWAIARPPVFAGYLAFAAIGSTLSGLAYQAFAS
jgi:uncharacterized protein